MERIALVSSMLASAGYDTESSVLEVKFQIGTVYRYFAVPKTVYEGLVTAESPGTFFREKIVDRYPCKRLR